MFRALGVVTLVALAIARTGLQALLVSAIQFNLILAIIAVAVIATIASIVVNAIVTVDAVIPVLLASPITIAVRAALLATTLFHLPLAFFALTFPIVAIIVAIIIPIIAILRLSGSAGRCDDAKNKCERQKSPANPFTKIFHVCSCLPCQRLWQLCGHGYLQD